MTERKIDLLPLLRFVEALPRSGDVELTLLKSHLLVEEVLTQLICKTLKKSKYVERARLTFSQKVNLARSVDEISHANWVWEALRLLNQARNELAHNLTAQEIQKRLDRFSNFVSENNKEIPKEQDGKFSRFHWAVFATYTVIAAAANFDPSTLQIKTVLTE